MKHVLFFFLLLLSGVVTAFAQRSDSAARAADQGHGGNAAFDYYIGDAMNSATIASATLVVIPGMLRPTTPAGKGHIPRPIPRFEVYPSPASAVLYLKPDMGRGGLLLYRLFDAQGTLVWHHEAMLVLGNEVQQEGIRELAAGEYTLLVHWMDGPDMRISAYRVLKVK